LPFPVTSSILQSEICPSAVNSGPNGIPQS
jgi:hypothetical protein